jgi:hypothetical protein
VGSLQIANQPRDQNTRKRPVFYFISLEYVIYHRLTHSEEEPRSRGGRWVAFKFRTVSETKIRGSVNYIILAHVDLVEIEGIVSDERR